MAYLNIPSCGNAGVFGAQPLDTPEAAGSPLLHVLWDSWQSSSWPLHCWKGISVFIFILFSPVIAHCATASLQLDEIFFFFLPFKIHFDWGAASLVWSWAVLWDGAVCPLIEESCSSPQRFIFVETLQAVWTCELFFYFLKVREKYFATV